MKWLKNKRPQYQDKNFISSVELNSIDSKINLKPNFFGRIRTYFLTGIVVAAPITVTGWVAIWFIQAIDGWFSPFAPNSFDTLPISIPGSDRCPHGARQRQIIQWFRHDNALHRP